MRGRSSHEVVGLAALLAIAACGPEPGTSASGPADASLVSGREPSSDPEGLPSPETVDRTAQGAIDVVLEYYGAIAEGDYARAYEMWGPAGPPGQSFEAFVSGYEGTFDVRAAVEEPSEPEGAAGSVYVTVPVVVTARGADGTDQRFEGGYVVRRVNDVPGAEPWQLRWHIGSADLREVE